MHIIYTIVPRCLEIENDLSNSPHLDGIDAFANSKARHILLTG